MTYNNTINSGTPTQVAHPWRSLARTIVQQVAGWVSTGVVALVALLFRIDVSAMQNEIAFSVAAILATALAGIYAKVMAMPQVENFFVRYLPFLATGVHTEREADYVG